MAKSIQIYGVHRLFGSEITKYTAMYSVYVRFWLTLLTHTFISNPHVDKHAFFRRVVKFRMVCLCAANNVRNMQLFCRTCLDVGTAEIELPRPVLFLWHLSTSEKFQANEVCLPTSDACIAPARLPKPVPFLCRLPSLR